jgi:hypothetical protein
MFGGTGRRSAAERRRGVALAGLALAALLLHAVLLGGLDGPGSGEPAVGVRPSVLTVRMVEPAPPTLPPPASAMPPLRDPTASPVAEGAPRLTVARQTGAQARPPPAVLRAPVVRPAAEPAPPAPGPSAAPAEAEPPVQQAGPLPAEQIPTASFETPLPAGPPSASDRELPVYRTLVPPPTQLRYRLRRGALQGTADFQWLPQGERYEARLEGRLAGLPVLTQLSQGGFDEAGVAPLRFTDRRATGSLQAANFQREAGKISFSGPGVEYPLLIGSQDRLSWMVQLAAVVAAEPQRLQDGGKVVIHVVGARGDSRVWVFRYAGQAGVRTGVGIVQSAHFVRDTAEPYDTRVDVWLDPQRHHLPARAVLRSGPDDEGLELLLQESVPVP